MLELTSSATTSSRGVLRGGLREPLELVIVIDLEVVRREARDEPAALSDDDGDLEDIDSTASACTRPAARRRRRAARCS